MTADLHLPRACRRDFTSSLQVGICREEGAFHGNCYLVCHDFSPFNPRFSRLKYFWCSGLKYCCTCRKIPGQCAWPRRIKGGGRRRRRRGRGALRGCSPRLLRDIVLLPATAFTCGQPTSLVGRRVPVITNYHLTNSP